MRYLCQHYFQKQAILSCFESYKESSQGLFRWLKQISVTVVCLCNVVSVLDKTFPFEHIQPLPIVKTLVAPSTHLNRHVSPSAGFGGFTLVLTTATKRAIAYKCPPLPGKAPPHEAPPQ